MVMRSDGETGIFILDFALLPLMAFSFYEQLYEQFHGHVWNWIYNFVLWFFFWFQNYLGGLQFRMQPFISAYICFKMGVFVLLSLVIL